MRYKILVGWTVESCSAIREAGAGEPAMSTLSCEAPSAQPMQGLHGGVSGIDLFRLGCAQGVERFCRAQNCRAEEKKPCAAVANTAAHGF